MTRAKALVNNLIARATGFCDLAMFWEWQTTFHGRDMEQIVRYSQDARREPREVRAALRGAPVPAHAACSRSFARRSAKRAVQKSGQGGAGGRADRSVLLLEVLYQEEWRGQSSGGRESIDKIVISPH